MSHSKLRDVGVVAYTWEEQINGTLQFLSIQRNAIRVLEVIFSFKLPDMYHYESGYVYTGERVKDLCLVLGICIQGYECYTQVYGFRMRYKSIYTCCTSVNHG